MNAIYRESAPIETLHIHGAVIDLARREVVGADQRRAPLGRVESALLSRLTQTPAKYVSPDELLALLWPEDVTKTHNSVQSVVARVRRALRGIEEGDKLVQTGYGRGYRFVPPRSMGASEPGPAPVRWPEGDVAALATLLAQAPVIGVVLPGSEDLRTLVQAAVETCSAKAARIRFVNLTGARTTRAAIRRVASAIGANLRGLSLERTQLKLVCQILEREPSTLLTLVGADRLHTALLAPLVELARRAEPFQLLIGSAAPLPALMPRMIDLRAKTQSPASTETEAQAARQLVRCLRALESGEYGRALSLVSDPTPPCEAPGLRVELLLARVRAEEALGMMHSALEHAEEALAAAHQTSLAPLRRRAQSLRDTLEEQKASAGLPKGSLRVVS
ncbi:MAG: winged helix-turn-helix domain-containing protein [Deltaproteobacteria bacterium]|nr:winged helix-turn-helix domain-containing protein [Deltaproteobacteria bacterium]